MKLVKFKEDNLVLGIGILDIDDVSENQYKKWEKQISENRKKRVDCYKKSIDKKRCVCAEILIKELGFYFLKSRKKELNLLKGKNGRPFLEGVDCSISISHSGKYVVGIISEVEVGIDIEKMSDQQWLTINHILGEKDLEYIRGQEKKLEQLSKSQNERFFEVWTTKEAYSKMCGTGLTKYIFSISHTDIVSKSILFDEYVVSYIYRRKTDV